MLKSNRTKAIKSTIVLIAYLIMISAAFILYKNYSQQTNTNKPIINSTAYSITDHVDENTKYIKKEENDNFELKIEKINISAPIILNVDGAKEDEYYKALESGVAHMKGTPEPSGHGNVVIFGHSSKNDNYIGDYGKIFANLDDVAVGDEIKITKTDNNNKEYVYNITEKKIISADDISVISATQNDQLTILTCWPIGSNEQRLAVIAVKK
jgi:sortase A